MKQLAWVFLVVMTLLALAPAALAGDDGVSTVSIRIDGVDVTDDVVIESASFQSIADGQYGEANIVIDDLAHVYSGDDIKTGMTLELYIDGTREWDGWVFTVKRAWPLDADDTSVPSTTPRLWKIRGYDRNLLFQKRFMYRVAQPDDDSGFKIWPTETTDKAAIEYALEHYVDLSGDGLTFDIESVASPGPYEDFTLGYVAAPLGTLFEDAAKITGAVFYISPQRVLKYVDDMTVTAPYVLTDTPTGVGQVGYRDLNAIADFTHAANQALVWGAGKGSADPVFADYMDAGSVADHGLWQWGDLYLGAWKQETVNRRARTYVEGSKSHRRGHGKPNPVVTATVFEPGFQVGQVVDFRADVFNYQKDLPIRKSTITFPSKSTPRYDLELSLQVDTPFGVPDLWNYNFPPWDTDEVIPPEGPGGIGGGDPVLTCTDTLIDHYDDNSPDLPVATSQSVGLFHSIALPPHAIGQTLHLFVVESYPPDGFPIQSSLETLGFTYNNMESIDGFADYMVSSYYKVLDGTESFFGGTLDLVTPDPQSVLTMASVLSGTVTDDAGARYWLSVDPPSVDPSWPTSDMTAWMTVAISLAPITGDPSGFINAWSDSNGTVSVRASLKNGTGVTTNPSTYTSAAMGTYSRAALTVALRGGYFSGLLGAPDYVPLVTPGPEVTGADPTAQPGGNPYTIYAGTQDAADSHLVLGATTTSYLDYGKQYSPVSVPGDGTGYEVDEEYPIGPPSLDGDVELLFKVQVDALTGTVSLRWDHHPQDAWDGEYGLTNEEVFWTRTDWLFMFLGSDGIDFQQLAGYENYRPLDVSGAGRVFPWQTGSYWIRWQYSGGYGYLWDYQTDQDWDVLGGSSVEELQKISDGRLRLKIWHESEAEPEEWLIDTPELRMWDSVSRYYGAAWATGLAIRLGSTARLDGIWSKECTLVAGGSGATPTDVPIYDNPENTEAGTYVTRYPYQPGSLRVYFQGILMRAGTDYTEVDPASGTFRILGNRDISSQLYVRYRRSGTVPTASGGAVYRPAPVLQYGWGTPLDGWNCTFACGVMALDRHTLGANTPYSGTPRSTPPNQRGFQSDQVGGADLFDLATAWSNGWGETLYDPGVTSWSNFVSRLASGRGAVLQGRYGDLPASKRFSNSFTGPHAIYINEVFSNGTFWGCDPLYRYPVIYTAAELQAYAEGLSFVDPGYVSAAFTRATA